MNIALLDDHDLIRLGLHSILSNTTHHVSIDVANADALFEKLMSGTPCDLILLDILLPGTNGVEVAQRLRAEYPNIKIIVVSMEAKEYTIIQLMQIGIDGFISKNGPMEEVVDAIDSVEEGVPYYGRDLAVLVRDIVDARLDKKSSSDGWYIRWVPGVAYYDAVVWAKRIPMSCRTNITRAGLGDYCCPPMGLAKLWNSIPGNKAITWVQGSEHGYVPPEYEGRDFTMEK